MFSLTVAFIGRHEHCAPADISNTLIQMNQTQACRVETRCCFMSLAVTRSRRYFGASGAGALTGRAPEEGDCAIVGLRTSRDVMAVRHHGPASLVSEILHNERGERRTLRALLRARAADLSVLAGQEDAVGGRRGADSAKHRRCAQIHRGGTERRAAAHRRGEAGAAI